MKPRVTYKDVLAALNRPDVQDAIERASIEADETAMRFVHELDTELVGAKNVLVEVIIGSDEGNDIVDGFLGQFLDL